MSQGALAEAAGVSLSTVRDFELGNRKPIAATLGAMRAVLEGKGIGFSFEDTDERKPCGITYTSPS